eukprot:scaffold63255_cov60-Phaeocystis_antarctica.AAC.5
MLKETNVRFCAASMVASEPLLVNGPLIRSFKYVLSSSGVHTPAAWIAGLAETDTYGEPTQDVAAQPSGGATGTVAARFM